MFLQSSPLLSSVVRMEFGREVFHDGLEPLDASRLAQGEKGRCATPAFHRFRTFLSQFKPGLGHSNFIGSNNIEFAFNLNSHWIPFNRVQARLNLSLNLDQG